MPELNDNNNIINSLGDNDLIVVQVGGVVKRITKANLLGTGGGGPVNGIFSGFTALTFENVVNGFTNTAGILSHGGSFGTAAGGVDTQKLTNGGIFLCQFKSDVNVCALGFAADSTDPSPNAFFDVVWDVGGAMYARANAAVEATLPNAVVDTYYGMRWRQVSGTWTWEAVSTTDGTNFTVLHTYQYTGGIGSEFHPLVKLINTSAKLHHPQAQGLS